MDNNPDISMEAGIVGSCIYYPQIIPDVVTHMKPEHLDNKALAYIYSVTLAMYDDSKDITAESVYEEANRVISDPRSIKRYPYESVALVKVTPQYIGDLVAECPTSTTAIINSRLVRSKGLKRQLIGLASDINHICKITETADEAVENVQDRLTEIMVSTADNDLIPSMECVAEHNEYLEAKMAGEIPPGIPYGFNDLDRMTGGMHRSELIIVAARPSVGKTAFCLSTIHNLCTRRYGGIFFSAEQGRKEIMERFCSIRSGVPLFCYRQGKLTDEQMERHIIASEKIANWNLFIDDSPHIHVNQIIGKTRKAKLKGSLDFIFIDYLQLLGMESSRSRHEEIGKTTAKLKKLARELEIPVVLLAQLNRDADNNRPRMRDLKDSGNIEQDADVIIMLHKDQGTDDVDVPVIDLILAKQRQGPTGDLMLNYNKILTRFENFEPDFSKVGF